MSTIRYKEMQPSQTIPGKLIAKLHLEPSEQLDAELQGNLEGYLKLLHQQIKDGDLRYVSSLLRPQLFDLRIALFKQLQVNSYLEQLDDLLREKLLETPAHSADQSAFDHASLSAFINYRKIISPLLNRVVDELNDPEMNYGDLLPTYHDLNAVVIGDVSGHLLLFKRWTDASLDLDFAMIVGELMSQGELTVENTNALTKLIYESLEDFGYYAALLGIWMPNEEDEDQIIRNIKIRLSANQISLQRSYTFDQIKALLTA